MNILRTFLPYLGTTLIICGYIKISIFYNHFGIAIHNYLEFSEILTLFLPDIIRSGILLIIIYFTAFLTISIDRAKKNTQIHKEIQDSDSFLKRFMLIIKLQKELSVWSLIILFFTIVFYIWFPDKAKNYFITNAIIPVIFLINLLDFEFRRKFKSLKGNYVSSNYSNLAFGLIMFLMFTIQSSFSDIKRAKISLDTIQFSYGNEKIITSNKLLFLGQTKNYLFIRDEEKGIVNVYNRNQVRDFKLKKYKKKPKITESGKNQNGV